MVMVDVSQVWISGHTRGTRAQHQRESESQNNRRNPGACCDRDESTGSTGDSNRDSCAAGRSRDASTDKETRGGEGDCTGGGRHDGRDGEEGCARVHSGLCDRGDACTRLRDDAAQRVGGSTGDDERMERSLHCFLFFGFGVRPKFQRNAKSLPISTQTGLYNLMFSTASRIWRTGIRRLQDRSQGVSASKRAGCLPRAGFAGVDCGSYRIILSTPATDSYP